MCGFFGEWSFAEKTNRELLKRICALSKNRGPDSTGYADFDHLFMGFNRLAILDTSSAGMQPMKSPSGRYTIVYNGEIYNHIEIRKNLAGNFRGHSDTETCVHALDKFGVFDTVDKLDGMFAMVVWDSHDKKLHLVRDFAGIKPLFYGISSNGIVFGSQYDQIVLHPWFHNNDLDPSILKLYLTQHYVPAPFGIITGTHQVKPGEIITIDSNQVVSNTSYWELPEKVDSTFVEKEAALELISNELKTAVRDEMLSDVPLGTFLSGGIDSPLVTFYSKQFDSGLKGFTIGSDSKVHDESDDAQWYANSIGIKHYLNQMDSSDALNYWDRTMSSMHEPFADFSLLPTFVVSDWASREVKVALSGDGGDELFFGYERFWSVAKNIKYHNGPYWWRYLLYGIDKVSSGNKKVNGAVLSNNQGMAHQNLHSRFNLSLLNKIFPDLKEIELPSQFDNYRFPHQKSEISLIQYMRKAEFYGMMQKTLRKMDLASMENSLEVRVPFLKKSFIESAIRIDPGLSYGSGRKKQLLKDLLIKNISNSPIDDRKRGFSIPLSKWIKEDLRAPILDTIRAERLKEMYGVETRNLDKLIHWHISLGVDQKWPIFTIYALFKWQENLEKLKSSLVFQTSIQREAAKP